MQKKKRYWYNGCLHTSPAIQLKNKTYRFPGSALRPFLQSVSPSPPKIIAILILVHVTTMHSFIVLWVFVSHSKISTCDMFLNCIPHYIYACLSWYVHLILFPHWLFLLSYCHQFSESSHHMFIHFLLDVHLCCFPFPPYKQLSSFTLSWLNWK